MKSYLHYLLYALSLTLWSTVCFIAPDFVDNPVSDLRGLLTVSAYVVALGGASFLVLYALSAYRWLLAAVLPLYAMLGAAVSYYRVVYHATVTPMIIDATLHTNAGTVAGVVAWDMVVWILVNLLIAVAFILWRFRCVSLSYAWAHLFIGILLLMGYYHCNGRLHNSINQRYPFNVVVKTAEYVAQQRLRHQPRVENRPIEVFSPDSIDVIFVLGEAMRADHWSLNGYERETNPRLSERRNVCSLPYVYSDYTYTAASIPHILTAADSLHPDMVNTTHSLVSYFHDAGFATSWLSNQDYGDTYVSFIYEADTLIFPNASKSVFVFDPWYDECLLPHMDSLSARGLSRNLYVLHTIGSHWYYNNHVPESAQVFQPVTTNRTVTNNSASEVINSYDNTAYYLDQLLDSIILRYESRCAVLIYLSDHGESLGEEGLWLHAGSGLPTHYPAALVWYSDAYAATYPDKVQALKENRTKCLRTDFLFYSILSAAGIEIEGADRNLDIFSY